MSSRWFLNACYRSLLTRTRSGQSERRVQPAPNRTSERSSRLGGQIRILPTEPRVTFKHAQVYFFSNIYFWRNIVLRAIIWSVQMMSFIWAKPVTTELLVVRTGTNPAANRVMKKCFSYMVLRRYRHVFRPYFASSVCRNLDFNLWRLHSKDNCLN